MNPYRNGRSTSGRGPYQRINEPAQDDSYYEEHASADPLTSHTPYNNSGYIDSHPEDESYSSQVGAERVPSYLLPPEPEPYIGAATTEFDAGAPEPVSYAPAPWDANDIGSTYVPHSTHQPAQSVDEASLLSRPLESRPAVPQRMPTAGGRPARMPSFASSMRRYFDPESQSTRMRRNSSIRYMFGRPGVHTIDEYADEEGEDEEQIPITGDEYQLNTWDSAPQPQRSSSYGYPAHYDEEGNEYRSEYADDYAERSAYPSYGSHEMLEPWAEEEDGVSEAEKDVAGTDSSSQADDDEKVLRSVQLFHGNLVLDCPVSAQLLQQYPEHSPVREFTHMRYTAATCDPRDFVDQEYTLRQTLYSQPRETEIFVCVTIYNEDDVLLGRTLQGVFNNIRHLCHRDRSQVWGPEAWKKVVVAVVADGRDKLNPRSKALMAALGAYQEGFAKNMVNDNAVEAHIYEYTSMVRISGVSDKEGVKLTAEKATPVQLLFCMKERNKRKINSHRWFFQAFSEVLRPKVCVLLDAGTRPGNHSIYQLWKSFDINNQVAGACGEIAAMLGTGGKKLINPLVAAQNFEYKMSNILDKPSESAFGFITVLPGAFSAYRWEALRNHPNGTGPLEKYFRGEALDGKGGVFQANMYLAEDRILCWELVSKRGSDWVLRYVKSAKAHTDVPERLSELILQRRRWLNGSFFAQIYSLAHFFQIWGSGHSIGRKLAFHFQFLYQLIAVLFSWFSLANFFLVFNILATAVGDPSANFAPGRILGVVLTWVYAACILTVFILSFGNRPTGTRKFYDMIVVFFSLMMAYMIFSCVYISVKSIQYAICANGNHFDAKLLWTNSTFRDLIISLLATYALYLLASIMFTDPWHVLTSLTQYVLLSPAYINVFNVYAFCNTHDISWGTKGDTAQRLDLGVVRANEAGRVELELPTSTEQIDAYYLDEINVLSEAPEPDKAPVPSESDKQKDYYALFRSTVVLIWVLMNLALVGVVLNVGGFQTLIGNADGANSSSTSSGTSSPGSGAGAGTGTGHNILSRAAESACQEITGGGSKVSQIYMAVILWSVCFMAAWRLIFSTVYLFTWVFRYV